MVSIEDKIKHILKSHGVTSFFLFAIVDDLKTLVEQCTGDKLPDPNAFIPNSLMEKGTNCTKCGQHVKIYKRPLYREMVLALAVLYRLHNDNTEKQFFHLYENPAFIKLAGSFAKMKHWGFIEEFQKNDNEDKRTSGKWRITEKGIKFIKGELLVHKYVRIYNNTFYGFHGEEVSVHDVLGKEFSYKELINN